MATLQTASYDGIAKEVFEKQIGFSTAVRVGPVIHCAGQGGWEAKSGDFAQGQVAQIDKAFENVELALKATGGTGWDQVYKIRSYHIPLNKEAEHAMTRNFRKYMKHLPVWTCVGVTRLGEDDMLVEIEVEAYDPK
ncbi:hypothetical protein JCM8547_007179 [Rhodosporidiobolus lusitaniae]